MMGVVLLMEVAFCWWMFALMSDRLMGRSLGELKCRL